MMTTSIFVVAPFDIFSIKSGSSERVKSDLNAFLIMGYEIELFIPLKSRQYLKNVSSNVHVHSYYNIQSFELLPEKVRLLFDMYTQPFNPFFWRKFKKYNSRTEIIFAHFLYSPLASIIISKNVPIIYVSHGYEFGLIKQVTSVKLIHEAIHSIEKYVCNRSNFILCISESDKQDLIREYNLNPNKLSIMPNTINEDYFLKNPYSKFDERKKLGIDPNTFVGIFHGRMDYRPNLEALEFFLNEMIPYLEKIDYDFKILIVGAKMPKNVLKFKSEKLLVFSDVMDIRKYLTVSDVSIVPLKSGGGSRIKILECFASRIPVISTKKGAEGINYSQYSDIIISELSASDFVNHMIKLRNNSSLRDNIINNASDLLAQKYSSNCVTNLMNSIIMKCKKK